MLRQPPKIVVPNGFTTKRYSTEVSKTKTKFMSLNKTHIRCKLEIEASVAKHVMSCHLLT